MDGLAGPPFVVAFQRCLNAGKLPKRRVDNLSQKELTQEDRVNIFLSDQEESERLYSEGKFTEAFEMLNHAAKSFFKDLPSMNM